MEGFVPGSRLSSATGLRQYSSTNLQYCSSRCRAGSSDESRYPYLQTGPQTPASLSHRSVETRLTFAPLIPYGPTASVTCLSDWAYRGLETGRDQVLSTRRRRACVQVAPLTSWTGPRTVSFWYAHESVPPTTPVLPCLRLRCPQPVSISSALAKTTRQVAELGESSHSRLPRQFTPRLQRCQSWEATSAM